MFHLYSEFLMTHLIYNYKVISAIGVNVAHCLFSLISNKNAIIFFINNFQANFVQMVDRTEYLSDPKRG